MLYIFRKNIKCRFYTINIRNERIIHQSGTHHFSEKLYPELYRLYYYVSILLLVLVLRSKISIVSPENLKKPTRISGKGGPIRLNSFSWILFFCKYTSRPAV